LVVTAEATRKAALFGTVTLVALVALSVGGCSTERKVIAAEVAASVRAEGSTMPIAIVVTPTIAANLATNLAANIAATPAVTLAADSADSAPLRLVAAARSQVGVTVGYDGTYRRLDFPGGDVDPSTGVCTDVAIRALRRLDIDLQQRVNTDMRASFSKYPKKWGLSKPDPNIDHRRVPNLETYFSRRGYSLPVSTNPADYLPGDIVTMKLPLDHLGIVSDRKTDDGIPLVIHNVGSGTKEENVLFAWKLVGHFRVVK
jgi:uncharacterized protein